MKQYILMIPLLVACTEKPAKTTKTTPTTQANAVASASVPAIAAPESKPTVVAVSVPASIPAAKPTSKEKSNEPGVDVSLVEDGLYQVESFIVSEDCKKTKKRKDMPYLSAKKEDSFMGKMLTLSACKSKTSCDKTYTTIFQDEEPIHSSFNDGSGCELTRTTLTLTVKDATLTLERKTITLPVKPGGCPDTGEIGIAFEARSSETTKCESYETVTAVKAGNR